MIGSAFSPALWRKRRHAREPCGWSALLFLNNIDGGITSHGPASGPLAEKCFHIAARGSYYFGAQDAVLQYRPTDPEFLSYCEGITGIRPRTFAPSTPYESTTPLSLIDLAERDVRLMETLRREGAVHDWAVCPFIHTSEVASFAVSLGLPVHGISQRVLASDAIARLNDKLCFQEACHQLRIPTPPSVYARGWHSLVAEATNAFSTHGRVKLRLARGAAGLGICGITPELLAGSGTSDVGRYLEAVLHDSRGYWTDRRSTSTASVTPRITSSRWSVTTPISGSTSTGASCPMGRWSPSSPTVVSMADRTCSH